MPIRFENLKSLLRDMENRNLVIASFRFQYNINTSVILKRYRDEQTKPNEYAKVWLKFIDWEDTNNTIEAYADFFEVYFRTTEEFIEFFNIQNRGAMRDIFLDFSNHFARFIPTEWRRPNNDIERHLLGGYAEGNNPNAIYCFDVRRNGIDRNGNPNTRSIENSNKAYILRPNLYALYKDDTNLSFFFSDNIEDERQDREIIRMVANRN
ncbi:DUF6037 family protein [uncultured Campylobacter sp.]|uniref:DUF6037 family protein n=1 Tax=uncultured Campylobacter sp. TaxID=218934 RepID=UPI0026226505|nr:DUF6037 family protein [uncultured Campylobacter sp.]